MRDNDQTGSVGRSNAALAAARAGLALLLGAALLSCGGGGSFSVDPVPDDTPAAGLTTKEVRSIVRSAAAAVDSRTLVIAVVDRAGTILAVFRKPDARATALGNFGAQVDTDELAVSLARTAAFFSNNQAPLSSRTVRFISGIHFPPGISFTPNAALYGIENTNRGCPLNVTFKPGKAVPPARSVDGLSVGLGIATGKVDVGDSDPTAVNPGGVPLFRDGKLVGGVGVAGAPPEVAEYAAFTGATGAGFGATPAAPGVVVIDGIALPFVNQTTLPVGVGAGSFVGSFLVGPLASPGPVPDGNLIVPQAGPLGGLTVDEVRQIVQQAVDTASATRAVIRLPPGSRSRMAIAVADLDGTILALHRMPDATLFSIDVAVAKARNVIYFSSLLLNPADLPGVPLGTAVTNRTISFGTQPFFPPGIDGTVPGPFFGLYEFDTANPCTQGSQPANPNQNGVVFFPGSVPLYKNGVLVGGLGVSGDGVEQDDFVSDGGSHGFEAPASIRADQIFIDGVRLPYLKFPRNPLEVQALAEGENPSAMRHEVTLQPVSPASGRRDSPLLIEARGALPESSGQPVMGVVGITFAVYRDKEGGAPLWLETQNVDVGAQGRYTVRLGATREEGVPLELFTPGESLWLGVQVQGQAELPRVLFRVAR